jgi:NAD dependent epimerase/dehydratase family enzyme
VLPKRLQETGYQFTHPTLEEALRAVVDRHGRRHEP